MQITKKFFKTLVTTIIICLCLFIIYYNRHLLVRNTSNWLSERTIPFNLLVSPHHVEKSIHPQALTLNEVNNQQYHNELKTMNILINSSNRHHQKIAWLSSAQNRQLKARIQKKSHRYFYSITPLVIGQNRQGKYTILSVNCREDTKQIQSYRYQIYYNHQRARKVLYLRSTHNNKPPKFIGFTNNLGTSGIVKAPNFIDTINQTLNNSDITNRPDASVKQYSQLGKNIGLDPNSGSALQRYALNTNADQKNSAITGYEFSDVPRETKFYLTQINKEQTFYYTLIYNRNNNRFTGLRLGRQSAAQQP